MGSFSALAVASNDGDRKGVGGKTQLFFTRSYTTFTSECKDGRKLWRLFANLKLWLKIIVLFDLSIVF